MTVGIKKGIKRYKKVGKLFFAILNKTLQNKMVNETFNYKEAKE